MYNVVQLDLELHSSTHHRGKRESNFAIRSKLGDFIELEDAQSQFHDPAEEEDY